MEAVGFDDPLGKGAVELSAERWALRLGGGAQPQAQRDLLPGADREVVPSGCLGATLVWIDRALVALDHERMKGILHVRREVRDPEQPSEVGRVFGE